ncbi:Uncharacterized protein Rs2_33721 [Raphanus sativus]|uniref:Uncharacterized protein LOC108815101 n=1 Tax=Raphanus sativus TaxID=3726 RepID=A0A6J0K5M8_RAPSA|nr:uncharacterized protein LOC108815101 [Raphanus sativus]KAJ4883628.1 Uncharacterized protein Rs2_33721 [Raphanus sativus]
MANSLPEIVTRETDPPLPLRRRTQLQSSSVGHEVSTKKEKSAINAFCHGLLTSVLFCTIVFVIMFFPNALRPCNVSFSVESISVSSPSSAAAIWHVDFLVNHPRSTCHVYYDADGVYAKLGFLNTAVLKTSHTRRSPGHTSFSVDLATEGNQTDVTRAFELDMKLSARMKQHLLGEDACGHFYITCQDLTLGYDKIKCQSSFKKLKGI